MSAEVIKLVPNEVGEHYRVEADEVLEHAKGRKWSRLIVIGELDDEDDLYVAGTANAGESLTLIEQAKLMIIGRD